MQQFQNAPQSPIIVIAHPQKKKLTHTQTQGLLFFMTLTLSLPQTSGVVVGSCWFNKHHTRKKLRNDIGGFAENL